MIAHITGKRLRLAGNAIIVDVNGIGYEVFVSAYTLGKLSSVEDVSLFVFTHVREDILALYGFLNQAELDMFKLLISVSGIGPKAALGILSVADVGTICASISQKDTSILTKVSGVGKRTAEKVVVELQNKVEHIQGTGSKEIGTDSEVIDALLAMGYNTTEARDALKSVPEDINDVGERIRLALKNSNKK